MYVRRLVHQAVRYMHAIRPKATPHSSIKTRNNIYTTNNSGDLLMVIPSKFI